MGSDQIEYMHCHVSWAIKRYLDLFMANFVNCHEMPFSVHLHSSLSKDFLLFKGMEARGALLLVAWLLPTEYVIRKPCRVSAYLESLP